MSMRLYDTARKAVVPFEPGPLCTMYTCGITPYDATHLGHATVYVTYDVLQRRLIDLGHEVRCVRNVTDVDDPLFAKARQLGVHYLDLAAAEEARFERDMVALNVLPVHATPRASSAIPDIRGFIGSVLERGYAYQANGSVYFDVSRFPSFGTVSNYSQAEMIEFARERGGDVDNPDKRHPLDFVLWQPSADDEPAWETMWGPGRPGWHIECSALALRELGATVDLHGGGADLIFPHHECERAQSEAVTGRPFVRHWMHVAMVYMDGHKMSKSLGNLVFVDQLREQFDPRAIRLAIIEHHYRNEWSWDDDLMPRAAARLERWLAASGAPGAALDDVRRSLDDDLDTPGALAAIDAAVARGESIAAAAALLGIDVHASVRPTSPAAPVRSPSRQRHQAAIGRISSAHAAAVGSLTEYRGAGKAQDRTKRIATPIARRLWKFDLRGFDQLARRRSGDPLPEPRELPRFGVLDADAAAPDQLRRQGRVHGFVEDQVPLPGARDDPDRSRPAATSPRRHSTPPRRCCAGASCSASSPRAPVPATGSCTRAAPARPGWR